MLTTIYKLLNENHCFAIASVIAILAFLYLIGCQSTVPSLLDPKIKVTRSQLEAEIDTFIANADARIADLDRKDEIRRILLDKAAIWATTGQVNWQGLLNTGVSVFAIGSALDQRRKYKSLRQTIDQKEIST